MAVTQLLQIPDPFPVDDEETYEMPEFDVLADAGVLGLHLGVLRRFAMLSLGAPVRPAAADR